MKSASCSCALITVAVLVVVAASGTGSKCIQGPSYWCQSSETARECGEESYCLLSYWKDAALQYLLKPELKSDSGNSCCTCYYLQHYLRPYAFNNETKEMVRNAVTNFCSILLPEYSQECMKNFSGKQFDIWWNSVQTLLNKSDSCNVHGYCPAKSPNALLKPAMKEETNSCCACHYGYSLLYNFFNDGGEEALIKSYLSLFCPRFIPQYKEECNNLIMNFDNYWKAVVSSLADGVDVVCGQDRLGLCGNTTLTDFQDVGVVKMVTDFYRWSSFTGQRKQQ